MQQRKFDFPGECSVSLLCREPPEAQAGRTLTWQLDGESRSDAGAAAKQPAAGEEAGGAAAATAPAAAGAADPDLIGLDIWPASIALCRYLAAHPELVVDQRVVELGAGGCCRPARTSSTLSCAAAAPAPAAVPLISPLPAQPLACPPQAWGWWGCCAPSWVLLQCC